MHDDQYWERQRAIAALERRLITLTCAAIAAHLHRQIAVVQDIEHKIEIVQRRLEMLAASPPPDSPATGTPTHSGDTP